ncbi:MAG: sigma-70 family RNA polymerase sigma factor [Planctomycetota bacterium]
MTHPSDPRSTAAGDDFALELASLQPRLYGFILKRLANREQASEVLQQTNLVLCRKVDEFEAGSSLAAWAFTVAKFQILAWRKTQHSSRLVFTEEVTELLDRPSEEELSSIDARIPLLRRCLEKLREQDRVLVQSRYRDGKPISVLAQSVSKSVDAISMQLSRVRRQLGLCVKAGLTGENS